jgi:ADP-heptose:LPS heptosyltransferase
MAKDIFSGENIKLFELPGYSRFCENKPRTKALIVHTGGIGRCLAALWLADFLKQNLGVAEVDFIGRYGKISFLPRRSPVDRVKDFDRLGLKRLECEPADYELPDNDALAMELAGYEWVINFVGEKGGRFEQNLIYTLYQTTSSEFVTLSASAPRDYSGHISRFHVEEFYYEKGPSIEALFTGEKLSLDMESPVIRPAAEDADCGRVILTKANCENPEKAVILAPGSGKAEKNWALENYIALAAMLSVKGYRPVWLIGPNEQGLVERIKSSGDQHPILHGISLDQLAAVIAAAGGYIGNDTGTTQLSAMLGTPTLAVFGETNHIHYGPQGAAAAVSLQSGEGFIDYSKDQVNSVFTNFEKL